MLGDSGKVAVINTADNTVVKEIDVGGTVSAVAVAPDGKHVYATSRGGKVAVIDTATNTMTATVNLGGEPEGIAVG